MEVYTVILTVITVAFIEVVIFLSLRLSNHYKKYDGSIICGKNKETGQTVYRIEFDIPLEDISKREDVRLNILHTSENLGINQRLYDLEAEGIKHDSRGN